MGRKKQRQRATISEADKSPPRLRAPLPEAANAANAAAAMSATQGRDAIVTFPPPIPRVRFAAAAASVADKKEAPSGATALPVAPAAKLRGALARNEPARGRRRGAGDPRRLDEAGGDPRGRRESEAARRSPQGENQPTANKQERGHAQQTKPKKR